MANGSDDMVLPMLREWRIEIRAMFCEMNEQFEAIGARLDRLESGQQAINQVLAANAMISKRFSRDFQASLAAWFSQE